VLDVVHAGEGYIKTSAHAGGTLRPMVNQLSELVALVARWALEKKYRIVTAESCTGGWIAKSFTDAAGSSRWFECGYVTYSNAAKARDLGVTSRTLDLHGAVSEPTVREMAAGALRVSGADVSIAVSGIAGPDGGTAEKPVGTVWFCVARRVGKDGSAPGVAGAPSPAAGPGIEMISEGEVFAGDRETVRRASVKRALELVLRLT
jgi:nicotinamide-nucleotide amidase